MIYVKGMIVCDTDNCGATTDVLMKITERTVNVGLNGYERDDSYPELPDDNTIAYHRLTMTKHPEGWLITDDYTYCPDCTDRRNHGK